MEIKLIIVGELPDSCFHGNCIFPNYIESQITEYWRCSITDKMIKDAKQRPSWCPLVIEEVCEWVLEKTERGYAAFFIPKDHEQHPNCYTQDAGEYKYCPECGRRIIYKDGA